MEHQEKSESGKIKVLDVTYDGKISRFWRKLEDNFLTTANNILDNIIDPEENKTPKDELKEFTAALIDSMKSKLKKPGIENEKLLAEIEHLYATKKKELADTRRINAEAKSIEISNQIKQLKLSIGIMKVLSLEADAEHSLLFTNRMDSFIDLINSLEH